MDTFFSLALAFCEHGDWQGHIFKNNNNNLACNYNFVVVFICNQTQSWQTRLEHTISHIDLKG